MTRPRCTPTPPLAALAALAAATAVVAPVLCACGDGLYVACAAGVPNLDGAAVPRDGELVPTNARAFLQMTGGGAASLRITVRPEADASESVNLDVDVARDVASAALGPLAPGAAYVVRFGLPESATFVEGGLAREVHIVAGDADDVTPPVLDGEAAVSFDEAPADACSFDGASGGRRVTIEAPPANEALAALELYRVDDAGLRTLRDVAVDAARVSDVLAAGRGAADGHYEVVALDLAGNASAPLVVDVQPAGCSGAGVVGDAPVLTALGALALLRRRRARRARR